MNKCAFAAFIATMFCISIVDAQVIMHVGPSFGRRYHRPYRGNSNRRNLPEFKPSLDLSVGYGFPNQDKDQLADFYNYYKGSITQSGPVTAALDYRFNRNMSIGVMVMRGEVSIPYYDYNNPSTIALNGKL